MNYQENRFKYNGKELQSKEFADGSGLEMYDFKARILDPQIGRWASIDPLATKLSQWSPYVSMADNPVRYVDPNGKKFINFDANGNYTGTTKDNWWHNLWHGSKGRILNNEGKVTQKFSFADPKNDVKDIQNGVIKRVEFVKETDIVDMMANAGVLDRENKLENRTSRYEYIREQGKGGGRLDFSYSGIPNQYPDASRSPVSKPSSMIFLVDGVAHNHMNFGNFLFGAAGAALGLGLPELLAGAHYNSLVNTQENNYSSQFDTSDDQYSIMKGFEHGYANYYKEMEYSGKVEIGPLLPISVF